MPSTIKDIAEVANVSPATVSLVLNHKGNVAQETRERVFRVAEELKYRKSQIANSARHRTQQRTIAFLKLARHGHTVNRDHNVFIADYIDGIADGARARNYKMEILSFESTPIEEIITSLTAEQPRLSGAIVLGTELSRNDVAAFRQTDIPVVFIDTFIDFLPFDFIDMNNQDSVYSAVDYFISHGHTEIGMICSSVQTRNFELRRVAFHQAMSFFGLQFREEYVFNCDSTFQGAYEDMCQALEEGADLPTALFCTNDIIAFGVLRALREHGYTVPDDISLIGFDDLPSGALMNPPLTTVAVSKQEIGRVAATRLDERILNPDAPVAKIVIGGALVERNSVKRLPGV